MTAGHQSHHNHLTFHGCARKTHTFNQRGIRMPYRCAILGVLFSSVLSSQTITGSITGTVTDAAKAVVADAKIVATNTGANLIYSTTTNETGVYNLLFLPVGQYTVSATAPGTEVHPVPYRVLQRTESRKLGSSGTPHHQPDELRPGHQPSAEPAQYPVRSEVLLLTNAGKSEYLIAPRS
jgi:hypothetical protein